MTTGSLRTSGLLASSPEQVPQQRALQIVQILCAFGQVRIVESLQCPSLFLDNSLHRSFGGAVLLADQRNDLIQNQRVLGQFEVGLENGSVLITQPGEASSAWVEISVQRQSPPAEPATSESTASCETVFLLDRKQIAAQNQRGRTRHTGTDPRFLVSPASVSPSVTEIRSPTGFIVDGSWLIDRHAILVDQP